MGIMVMDVMVTSMTAVVTTMLLAASMAIMTSVMLTSAMIIAVTAIMTTTRSVGWGDDWRLMRGVVGCFGRGQVACREGTL